MHRIQDLVLVLAGLLIVSPLPAATLTVDLSGGADYADIQSAIDAAVDGDTVLVKPGEYAIAEPITFKGEAIAVKSEAGAEVTAIRGGVVGFSHGESDASFFCVTRSTRQGTQRISRLVKKPGKPVLAPLQKVQDSS